MCPPNNIRKEIAQKVILDFGNSILTKIILTKTPFTGFPGRFQLMVFLSGCHVVFKVIVQTPSSPDEKVFFCQKIWNKRVITGCLVTVK